jgi:hypothetical protein
MSINTQSVYTPTTKVAETDMHARGNFIEQLKGVHMYMLHTSDEK